jgi:hypothetical protein
LEKLRGWFTKDKEAKEAKENSFDLRESGDKESETPSVKEKEVLTCKTPTSEQLVLRSSVLLSDSTSGSNEIERRT